jgi:hypothetical protein
LSAAQVTRARDKGEFVDPTRAGKSVQASAKMPCTEDLNMTTPSSSAVPNSHPMASELVWSKSERPIARKAFEHALAAELQEVIQRAKQMAAKAEQPSDLWELEDYLTQRRNEIDRKYDSRGSVLVRVLGGLLYEGRITEEHLQGLREDKLRAIRSCADFMRRS